MESALSTTSLSGLHERDMDELRSHLAEVAPSLRNARILVTGATGWFGTWLLDALIAIGRSEHLNLRIVALSRAPEAFAHRHPHLHAAHEIDWIRGDVRDASLQVDGPITHVIHGATEASAKLNAEEPDRMFDTIVNGTRNVLRLAAAHRDAKVLLISSGAVYGIQPAGVHALSEEFSGVPEALDPANAYAEGKRSAEHLAAIWYASHGLDVKIARCFAFVGPHMPFDAHFAIGNFIRDANESDAIRIAGNGLPLRSYLYMTDLVEWLLTILVEGRTLRPYNVGASEPVSIRELASACAAANERAVRVVVAGEGATGRDYVPSIERARSELGLRVRVTLDDAIARTTAWKHHAQATVTA